MKYCYRVYTSQNLAETWRDPDEFVEKDLGYFISLKKAEDFIKNYIRYEYKHFGVEREVKEKVKFNEDGIWYWTDGGSWSVAYVIKRNKVE